MTTTENEQRCGARIGSDGCQCGLPNGHTGTHTLLIPSSAPWFRPSTVPSPPVAPVAPYAICADCRTLDPDCPKCHGRGFGRPVSQACAGCIAAGEVSEAHDDGCPIAPAAPARCKGLVTDARYEYGAMFDVCDNALPCFNEPHIHGYDTDDDAAPVAPPAERDQCHDNHTKPRAAWLCVSTRDRQFHVHVCGNHARRYRSEPDKWELRALLARDGRFRVEWLSAEIGCWEPITLVMERLDRRPERRREGGVDGHSRRGSRAD